ncbi:CBS domain-containing protein [Aerococcus sp. 1KP-2016]|jgi:acetoin utilization protein AcuB|uniref:CBS domain-containing protein n=1 Tax=Aerococcus sp. 1KP-2016 TaxID=1981982 RepID=UPI000B981F12|nr:CBS domain-containing protein [Aerococcus sp. 1KP-2016]OYQ67619.1 hypothetical protein B9P78_03230 [Aerococcus sp. 1KP-2016]
MKIKQYMSTDLITVTPETGVSAAVSKMEEHKIHNLPVVKDGKYVGIITQDIIDAKSASDATSLSVYELNYILSKANVAEFMDAKAPTATTDWMVEEAAEFMRTNDLRVLPIVDGNQNVTGIITYKDIFKALIDLSGYLAGDSESRFVVKISEDRIGVISELTKTLADAGISVSHIFVNDTDGIEITIQVHGGQGERAKVVLSEAGYTVVDL